MTNVQAALRGYINKKNGIAGLNDNNKITAHLECEGVANGVAELNASSLVVQEPASKGAVNGIAELNASSLVLQEPASKGAANGIAELNNDMDIITSVDIGDYGGNFISYTLPTGSNGAIHLAVDTNAGGPAIGLYAYLNGAWFTSSLTPV